MMFVVLVGVLSPVVVAEIVKSRRKNTASSGSWNIWSLITGLVIVLVIISVGMWTGVIEKNITTDNPLHFEYSESDIDKAVTFEVDQSGFEKVLRDETGVEGVIINNNNDAKKTFEHLQQGKFISFEGIKENSRIEGSVYFSENSMVILMDDKGDFENKIVVPTK